MTKEEREKAIDLLDNLRGMIEDNQGNDYDFALKKGIEALETLEDFERAQIITGGRLNGRTYAYKRGLEDGKRKALEQESCEDCVSRQAVKDGMIKYEFHSSDMTITEFVKDVLPPVTPTTRWIPVSEKLPEDGELVLFSTKTDRVFEGRFFVDKTDLQWYAFRDKAFAYNNVVTAWLPLPKPYKAEMEVEE